MKEAEERRKRMAREESEDSEPSVISRQNNEKISSKKS